MNTDIAVWKQLATSTVSDALDRCGISGQCMGIKPLDLKSRAIGRAFTVKMIPASSQRRTVGDYVDDVPPGYLVVIDNDGRTEMTVWGDILTSVADRRGVAGTVIDGVCRDTSRSLELNYPIFSRGIYMRTGKDRVEAESFNQRISVGGATIEANDLVIGDADGVVVIPQSREQEVLELALMIDGVEEKIRSAVNKGARLDEARKIFGYFELQRAS